MTGIESKKALPIPVIIFVAPGQLVHMAIHVFHDVLAYHSAAKAHACSCFTDTNFNFLLKKIESSK